MIRYDYRAMDASGRILRGRLAAIDPADLDARLKRLGLDLVSAKASRRRRLLGRRVSRRELINFCFHLEQLTRSGVPIVEGLGDLRDSMSHRHLREVVAGTIESIEGGKTLSQAMAEHPRTFDPVFVSLVSAGEETGNVPEILHSLIDSLKWRDEMAAHTKKLLAYPAFLGVVVLAVTSFMMIYLVPKMAAFVRSMGYELPIQTRVLIAASGFLADFWHVLLLATVVAIVAVKVALATCPGARYRFDALKLALPVIGRIQRKIIFARIAAVFAMLYGAGIAVTDALRSTENAVGNVVIEAGLARAGRMIAEGQNVSAAFHDAGLFPPLVIRMLRIGESTGGLDTALLNVSYFYTRDVRESVGRAQTLLEPLMTLIIGALLGWVMLSVLGPIYDLIVGLNT